MCLVDSRLDAVRRTEHSIKANILHELRRNADDNTCMGSCHNVLVSSEHTHTKMNRDEPTTRLTLMNITESDWAFV